MKRASILTIVPVTVALLGGCASRSAALGESGADRREVTIIGADGRNLGAVTVSESGAGLKLEVNGRGMPVGVHGVHLHEKGVCEGPKFVSAGGHWNPAGKQHGRDNPAGAHLGDLPNLTVGTSGVATARVDLAGVAPTAGVNKLADTDGTSLVVHAKADDYRTDPSGNSGDRIACAVIAPPL